MSIIVKHQRSNSAPDGKSSTSANWDRAVDFVNKDLLSVCNQTGGSETLLHKTKRIRNDKLDSLKQDVERLQMMLKRQRATKGVMEEALARPSSLFIAEDSTDPSESQNLIKDITLLELEVMQLEQLLLSMYRDAFEMRTREQTLVSGVLNREDSNAERQMALSHQLATPPKTIKGNSPNARAKSGSLVSRILNFSPGSRSFNDTKYGEKGSRKAKSPISFSQPISFPRKKENKGFPSPATCELWREVMSAEVNATSSTVHDSNNSSNRLSEELVRCMSAIYCKLADPPISTLGSAISPSPSCSSGSTFSSRDLSINDGWSPHKSDSFDSMTTSSTFQGETLGEISTPYASMVAVQWIHTGVERLQCAEKMLHNFRSLVQQLEAINPGDFRHEEKLAFWLNIYNALMMHAYLAYGIPRSHTKRISLLQKASYKIGLHSVNAHTIESTILGCKTHRPSQWIQALLSPVSKFRTLHKHAYALDRPEPLACFALCSGWHSDPPLRVYTAKGVYQELEVAKKEFLRANITLHREYCKVVLPRLLESFSKETSMGSLNLLDWVCESLPEKQRKEVRACVAVRPNNRCVEWAPHNISFRYLFVRDLARWFPANHS
ncbi:hypothetical protein KP509_25G053000 [Ceratopteris richardii]|nr:hypothetical protein KP509_25G053000 [Ceratopteris richardii]